MKQRLYPLLALGTLLILASSCSTLRVYDLTCDGLEVPLAIDSETPHFSWKTLSDKPMSQVAYQIEVASSEAKLLAGEADLWQSGPVSSAEQIMVPYAGTPLSPDSNADGMSVCGTRTELRPEAVRNPSASESWTKSRASTSVPRRAIPRY